MPERFVRLATTNVSLVAGFVSFVLVLFRVLAVSRFEPTVAAGLISRAPTTSVLVGTALGLMPPLLVVSAVLLLVLGFRSPSGMPGRDYFRILGVAAGVLSLVVAPAAALLVNGLLLGAVALAVTGGVRRDAAFDWDQWRSSAMRSTSTRVFVVAALAGASIGTLLQTEPWFPREQLDLETVGPVIGYIVGLDGDWVTVLVEGDRRLLVLPASGLKARAICRSADPLTLPLIQLLFPDPIPPCVEVQSTASP